MTTLLELVNTGKKVPVGDGKQIEVFGISAEAFIGLITEHPVLIKALSGGDVKPEDMMKVAPPAVAAFIAAGVGKPGDDTFVAAARKLNVGTQLDLMAEIFKLTFPSGVGPFVKKLEALGLLAAPAPVQEPGQSQSSPNSAAPVTNLSGLATPTPSNIPPGKSKDGSTSAVAGTTESRPNYLA